MAKYLREIDVGPIVEGHHSCAMAAPATTTSSCVCASVPLEDTIQRIFSLPEYVQRMTFPAADEQTKLFEDLQIISDVYRHLDKSLQTIFLRQTGMLIMPQYVA